VRACVCVCLFECVCVVVLYFSNLQQTYDSLEASFVIFENHHLDSCMHALVVYRDHVLVLASLIHLCSSR